MNILIIGDFSAFAKHLKDGFEKLGNNVTIVHNRDGFKKLEADKNDIDIPLKSLFFLGEKIPKSHILFTLSTNSMLERELKNKGRIDLIIVINYQFLSYNKFTQYGVSVNFLQKCLKNGAKLFMSCCGGDPATRNELYDYYKPMNLTFSKKELQDDRFDFLINNSHAIIPTAFLYKKAIEQYCKTRFPNANISKTIPLPLKMIEDVNILSSCDRKIVVFHGIIRPVEKGTQFFIDAMQLLEKNYPEEVECITCGGIPYDQYVKLFAGVDILLDQVYGDGMGVNAALGLMNGKVVMARNSIDSEIDIGYGKCPIINVEPDVNQIYSELEKLITNRDLIDKIKIESRNYAVRYLDSRKIAQRYLELL